VQVHRRRRRRRRHHHHHHQPAQVHRHLRRPHRDVPGSPPVRRQPLRRRRRAPRPRRLAARPRCRPVVVRWHIVRRRRPRHRSRRRLRPPRP
jgi:hypothetical protein